MECPPGADDGFGPQIHGCRDFDFTLLFEQAVLQVIPCALLLLSVPPRVFYLQRQTVKAMRNNLTLLKVVAITALACTQIAMLVVWCLMPIHRTRASIPATTISSIGTLALLLLSLVEDSRSVCPSAMINTYMLLSLMLDIPQARTLWLRPGSKSLPCVFTAGVVAKIVSLGLEACTKGGALFPQYRMNAPERLVSLYDRTVLWWLNPIFWLGFKNRIVFEDLFPLDDDMKSERLSNEFQTTWARYKGKTGRPLLWALSSYCWTAVTAFVLPRLVLSALKLSQPLLINSITGVMAAGPTMKSMDSGRGLIGATALVYCGLALSNAIYKRQLQRFLTRLRGVLVTSLYGKLLVLPSDVLADNTAITLINTDVQRVIASLQKVDDLFATPIEIGIAVFLLYRQIGVSCVSPIALSVCISTISIFTSNKGIKFQKKWLSAVSDRIAYTSSVLSCPKGWKMLGLTEYLIGQIQALRVKELSDYAEYRKFATYRNVFGAIPDTFAPSITLMTFTLLNGGSTLDATSAFTTLSLVALLSSPVGGLIHAVPLFQTALASVDRIQAFLQLEDLRASNDPSKPTPLFSNPLDRSRYKADTSIKLKPRDTNGQQQPEAETLELKAASVHLGEEKMSVLTDINFILPPGGLTVVVGAVGCGKSTLLRAVVGDVPLSSGRRLGAHANRQFAYCAQETWLPNATVRELIIGPYDLDETWLHAVTTACALDSDLASFTDGPETMIGTNGLSLSGGQRQRLALARAIYSRRSPLIIDDALSGLDSSTSQHVFKEVLGEGGLCKKHGITVLLVTHSAQQLSKADYVVAMSDNGRIKERGSIEELERSQGYIHCLAAGPKTHDRQEPDRELAPKTNVTCERENDVQHDLARRTGDVAVYWYYVRSIGWFYGACLLVTTLSYSFSLRFGSVWVQWWTDNTFALSHGTWIGIYVMLAAVAIANDAAQLWAFLVWTVPKSSGKLHELLLHAVMRAPYRFFTDTDAGVTLNRFSSDMTLIEIDLAGSVMQTLGYGALTVASAGLIVAGSRYAAAMLPVILLVIYVLQKCYLRTSRQIRFMDLEAVAPLITHCQETISGCTTIRAFGWQQQFLNKNLLLLDNSQQAFYLMFCIQRWLNLVLDLLTAGVAVLVVLSAVELRSTASTGSVGVALVNILGFNQTITALLTAWTTMETSLGAIARIKNFEADTPSEGRGQGTASLSLAPSWPEYGALEFSNVSVAYNPGAEILKGVSLSIPAGSKVGICGRSGSGKSSLLLTLLRLLDTSNGTILLDGQDLARVPRQLVRERITALPQEPVVLPGSLRSNLDHESHHSDNAILTALDKADLLSVARGPEGLNALVSDLSLSHGQLQLLAVTRALLRPSKIVILDEVTSSVDSVAETKILNTIHETFKNSTIIAVAHRLETIVDYDMVVVLDSGRIVEVGSPTDLLEKQGGWFASLIQAGH